MKAVRPGALACVVVAVTAACASPATHAGPDADLVRRIDRAAAKAIERGPQPGVTVAVARNGSTILAKGYGVADVAGGVAARPDTVHRIGSITKQFTAAAVLDLAERGLLGIDDVTRLLPEYPAGAGRLTLRHLLTHTSGIRDYTGVPEFRVLTGSAATKADVLAWFAGTSEFHPGTSWAYSNSNYFLLGLVIERASGEPYGDYLRERIFGPLAMRDTGLCPDRPGGEHDAKGYYIVGGKAVDAMAANVELAFAAGGLCSTAQDLLRWSDALHGRRFLSQASYDLMTTPVALDGGRSFPYGFGLMIDNRGGSPSFSHDGAIEGFSSSLSYHPADKTTIVVLANTGGRGGGELVAKIADAARPPCAAESIVAPTPAKAAPATVANGGFESARFDGWTVRNQPGSLGDWFVYSGALSPLSCSPVAAPPKGRNGAVTEPCGGFLGPPGLRSEEGRDRPCGQHQDGPGSHVLFQDVPLAGGMRHELRFVVAYTNQAGAFSAPGTLDRESFPNQQYRVDILRPSADPFSVAPGDVLAEVFRTRPGDPLTLAPTTRMFDLSPFAGTVVRIRFAEVDNLSMFQAAVDDVQVVSTPR